MIPTTACTNTSGLAERKFLAERFHIETVVTSTTRAVQFQREHRHTRIPTCLQTANYGHGLLERPTLFVALRTMPSTPEEAIEVVEAIQARDASEWVTLMNSPS